MSCCSPEGNKKPNFTPGQFATINFYILVIHFTLVMHADMSGHEPAWMPGVIRRENPGDSIDFAQRFAIKHGRPDAPDRGLPPRRRRYTSANVSTR